MNELRWENFAHMMGSEIVEHSTLPQSGDASQKLLPPCAKRARHFYPRHFSCIRPQDSKRPYRGDTGTAS